MIQAHYIYCAFYFQCYYISSTSDHQVLDPKGWRPPFYRIRSCWLLIQQLLREEVLKLLTIIMQLPISPFSSISFCLVCFIVLLFGAYAFGLPMFSWWIDPFYNYPMSLPVSGKFLCSEAYFIGYQPSPFSFDLLINIFMMYSPVDHTVKNLPAMQGTWVQSLVWEDSLEEMTTHSSILAQRIPWTEESGGLQSMGLQSCIQLGD